MRRSLYLALAFAPVLALVACDPDLSVAKTDAGAEGGPPAPPPPPPPESDGGTTDAADDATDDATADASKGHQVDGVNDFAPGEKLVTTSNASSYFAYAAWDAKNIYFGMEGADVSASTSNPSSKWVMVYLGAPGVPGSTTGLSYGGVQQPTLPFPAAWHLRFKIDGSYANVQKWSGSAFVDATIEIPMTTARVGSFLEMSITRAAIGSPALLDVHVNMLIEGGGADWTYAGAPSTSFTDGKNPTFTKYYEFDLGDALKAPNAYTPKP
jgi:hypothetical protein